MALREFSVRSVEPYAGGAEWGESGACELVRGVARFAVDPAHEANRRICDLGRAERGADGLVHFEADACLVRPREALRSRRLLFVVPNRGMPGGLPFSTGTSLIASPIALDAGDGFALRRGWSIAWCGWQWDVPRTP